MYDPNVNNSMNPKTIIFSTFDNFSKGIIEGTIIISKNVGVIIDEFDSIVFDPDRLTIDKLRAIKMISSVIAFSGSEIMPIHKDFL